MQKKSGRSGEGSVRVTSQPVRKDHPAVAGKGQLNKKGLGNPYGGSR